MSKRTTPDARRVAGRDGGHPHTLAIDIGGSRVKASVLDNQGVMLAQRLQLPTPAPATPAAVLDTIAEIASQLPPYQRISVGFPGVVRGSHVVTAPNLGTERWTGFDLVGALRAKFDAPVRMLNDAAVQGLGVVGRHGLECVMTLGTGVGCAVFRNGRLLLHLEFGQHRARKKLTYDQYIGQAAFNACGVELWNTRVEKAVAALISLTSCDRLYVGGGNARQINRPLPDTVTIVSNRAGITGGVRLWETSLDDLFEDADVITAPPS